MALKTKKTHQNRHWGLDVVRSFAILSVIYGHSALFFYPYHAFLLMSFFAVVGVEVFFVLSGFLIGSILLKIDNKSFNLSKIYHFWGRRWLRTLPAYFVVLFVVLLFKSEWSWRFIVFMQNYQPQTLALFPVTWSLTIEEWFYLLFPLLMLMIAVVSRGMSVSVTVFVSAIIMIATATFLRWHAADGTLGWDVVRKLPHLRLDVIGYGILLAYFNKRFPTLLKSRGYFVLCLLLFCVSIIGLYRCYMMSVNYETAMATLANSTLFFTVMSLCSVTIISLFYAFPHCSIAWLRQGFYFISVTSYSTYLVHFQIMNLFAGKANSYATAWLWFTIALILVYIASIGLYQFVEKPFLSLRSKLFAENNHKPY